MTACDPDRALGRRLLDADRDHCGEHTTDSGLALVRARRELAANVPPPRTAHTLPTEALGLVRLLAAAVELIAEADALHGDPAFRTALGLARRALQGLDPTGDGDDGVDALVQLEAVVSKTSATGLDETSSAGHTP